MCKKDCQQPLYLKDDLAEYKTRQPLPMVLAFVGLLSSHRCPSDACGPWSLGDTVWGVYVLTQFFLPVKFLLLLHLSECFSRHANYSQAGSPLVPFCNYHGSEHWEALLCPSSDGSTAFSLVHFIFGWLHAFLSWVLPLGFILFCRHIIPYLYLRTSSLRLLKNSVISPVRWGITC